MYISGFCESWLSKLICKPTMIDCKVISVSVPLQPSRRINFHLYLRKKSTFVNGKNWEDNHMNTISDKQHTYAHKNMHNENKRSLKRECVVSYVCVFKQSFSCLSTFYFTFLFREFLLEMYLISTKSAFFFFAKCY